MKIKKAILTGLIVACATMSYAQETDIGPEKAATPETNAYRQVLWANLFGQQNPGELTLSEVPFSELALTIPTNDVSAAWSNDVQMIVLFHDEDVTGTAEIEHDTAFTTNLNVSLLSQLTTGELLQWQYGGTKTEGNLSDQKGTKRTPTQILVIEPLDSRRGDAPGQIKVHEHRFDTDHPKPEWYEWFNPRLFLNKWAGYWNSETNATPVVLILFRF